MSDLTVILYDGETKGDEARAEDFRQVSERDWARRAAVRL